MTYKPTGLFNSHPHKEDDFYMAIYHALNGFSTHILTRRMTSTNIQRVRLYGFFNSHPHKEDDQVFGKNRL